MLPDYDFYGYMWYYHIVFQQVSHVSGEETGKLTEPTAYAGIFTASFLAATILPAQSEAGLAVLISSGTHSVVLLVFLASLGNTLGAVVNWYLGRGLERFKSRTWFPAGTRQLERAKTWYGRFGLWSLLLSWVPFIGDPITVASGFFRTPLVLFIVIVGTAKTLRYLVVAGLTLQLI
jgi:membrane protein YqaA with SNARE-associated domain